MTLLIQQAAKRNSRKKSAKEERDKSHAEDRQIWTHFTNKGTINKFETIDSLWRKNVHDIYHR